MDKINPQRKRKVENEHRGGGATTATEERKIREMRSFINWDILLRIENSPKEFIIQRNVALLNAFLLGYEGVLLQLENEEQLKAKYDAIPSLEEYARKKYNADNIGTRNFKSIISFTCEDERDFFDKYFDFLKEYEQKFPVQESISYILRETSAELTSEQKKPDYFTVPERPCTLEEWLIGIMARFPMYFDYYNISYLRAFLDGYFLCKKEYNIPLTTFETKVRKFTEGIICKDLKLTGEFVSWDRLYRFDRNWSTWGEIEEPAAKKILEEFWKELKQFTGETID
ncbi:MAG: hypothetical protein LBU73_04105 [Helicobacteraceae bacterium]|jgi:hypothetical protein|nr:hypothetical protein [Helicobacteraceae bacterium]